MQITPKNWATFQHYKNRRPPWIKLYTSLLDDSDWHCLPDASKALAIMLWLLASESESGLINADNKVLAFRLRTTPQKIRDALKPLIDEGFFVASTLIADCLQHAIPETERETELERDIETEADTSNVAKRPPPCPVGKIVDLYHQTLPELPKVMTVTKAREDAIKARWRQFEPDTVDEGIQNFENYFRLVRNSNFLMGKVEPANGRKRFFSDLEWLVNQSNFVKVIERKYHESK